MRSLFTPAIFLLGAVSTSCLFAAQLEGGPEQADISEKATHEQTSVIKLPESTQVNAFCLTQDGKILAACGAGPGVIHQLDADGKPLDKWPVAIQPEAINVAPDGTVLVAGGGRLLRLSAAGKELSQADSPHAVALRADKGKLRQQAIAQLKSQSGDLTDTIKAYEDLLAQSKAKQEKGELNEQEEQILKILPGYIENFKKRQAERDKEPEQQISEEAIQDMIGTFSQSKLRVASISADGKYVYVATPALAGYSYEVWRMNPDFTGGKTIISNLSGCCGQMDVQACASGIFVAENARHRVVSYQPDGKEVTAWGSRDRTGLEGFTSCCNPMNVCFNRGGDVFTAESTTGRIKRFGADGKFKAFIGDVSLVPGCKNVSIAVAGESERVYMLDMTRNHIVVMNKKEAPSKPAPSTGSATSAAAEE